LQIGLNLDAGGGFEGGETERRFLPVIVVGMGRPLAAHLQDGVKAVVTLERVQKSDRGQTERF
jgi:hypothetical protein